MLDPIERIRTRVGVLLREAMQERGLRWCDLGMSRTAISRALFGRKTVMLDTLVRLADAMNYDVIIQLRDRTAAQDVRKEV